MTQEETISVTVTDIKMPFWSIVFFMVKAAIASIPAIIILVSIFYLVVLLFALPFAALSAWVD